MFHYTYVLLLSLVALVPVNTDASLALIVAASAALCLVYSCVILLRVMRSTAIALDDRLGYGASPVAAYAAALVSAAFIFVHSRVGPPLLAGALILLLIVNIRNAWDLTIWFAAAREWRSASSSSNTVTAAMTT